MSQTEFLAKIESLFVTKGHDLYGGEAVTQLEHALQAAWLAEREGQPASLIVASLLHDVGHLLHGLGDDCAERGIDDVHEELGMRFLVKHFGPDVTEPVRLHVQAKRYLCHADPAYHGTLSEPSQVSLKLQGGPMSASEARTFEANPHHAQAVALRKYDDLAKEVGLVTPPYSHFKQYLETTIGGGQAQGTQR